MTAMRQTLRTAFAGAAVFAAFVLGGCSTGPPAPVGARALAEARTFPYFRVYWVGRSFEGYPLAAADGRREYKSSVGDSVYYGDCTGGSGVFSGGGCPLPLQVTTVVYRWHENTTLGNQQNVVIRGVPAAVYDEGHSIELYSGTVAIDVFSNSYAHALQAVMQLRPLNAPGSADGNLPPPVYCPGLWGKIEAAEWHVLFALPHQVCQRTEAAFAFAKTLGWTYP